MAALFTQMLDPSKTGVRNMKTALTLTALVLASAATGVAANQTQGMSYEEAFNQIDMNADGVLTQDEANVDLLLAERFEMLDVDGSGDLSMEEFQAFDAEASKES
jgi:Ca2+-binding EF-hand superfamily protein